MVVISALTSSMLAVPFTCITGVYRYTKLADGNVTVEAGGLYSSGDYTVSVNQTKTALARISHRRISTAGC